MAYGQAGVGIKGQDRRRGARSLPTGWETKQGDVLGQELEFGNGNLVLAVTVPNYKATIKGIEAWKEFIKRMDKIQQVVQEWISSEEKRLAGRPSETSGPVQGNGPAAPQDQALNVLGARVNDMEQKLNAILEAVTSQR